MAEQIPVTTALLTWARERAGLTRDEMVQKFKRFAEWEQGTSFPTNHQLEQLSEAFKVPIAVFFFADTPSVPPIDETFRTLPKSEIDKLPSRVRILLRKAKSLQLNLSELTQGRNPEDAFARSSAGYDASEATTELLAAQFQVSRELIFRRFLDQRRINVQQYRAAVERWNAQRQSVCGKEGGGDHYWTKLSYLGRDYVSLALSQFHQNRIDENQLVEYLDTKPKNISTLEEYFQRGNV